MTNTSNVFPDSSKAARAHVDDARTYHRERAVAPSLEKLGRRMRLLVLTIGCAWAAMWSVASLAQVLPKPDTALLSNGTVRVVLPLADGSVVIGGEFSHVNSVPRANLAKLAPDGSLDPDWAPQTNGGVHALAADNAGNIYVGGNFYYVNQEARGSVVRLSSTGTGALDPVWNPEVRGSVNAVILDNFGNVLVGGIFSQIGQVSRARIARLSSVGTGLVDPIWNPSADDVVTTLALGPGDSILVAGGFSNIGGQPRQRLAKLSGTGAGAADPNWNPGVDDRIEALETDASGRVYVAGYFSTIGGQQRTNIARLAGDSGAVDSWRPAVGGYISDLRIGPDGLIYVVGDFVVVDSRLVGGIARLSPTNGTIDSDWRPQGPDTAVLAVRFASNGDALIRRRGQVHSTLDGGI
jgi:hypothetical protein